MTFGLMNRLMASFGTWNGLWKAHANSNCSTSNTQKVIESNVSPDNADDLRHKARGCSGTHPPMSWVNLLNDTTDVTFA